LFRFSSFLQSFSPYYPYPKTCISLYMIFGPPSRLLFMGLRLSFTPTRPHHTHWFSNIRLAFLLLRPPPPPINTRGLPRYPHFPLLAFVFPCSPPPPPHPQPTPPTNLPIASNRDFKRNNVLFFYVVTPFTWSSTFLHASR